MSVVSLLSVLKPQRLSIALMVLVVLASNVLVQFPFKPLGLQDYLTYGAFIYPITFLVTELTNRRFGPVATRRVVYIGFAVAVLLSAIFATPRIALASGTAFLVSQLLDVAIFDRLRRFAWWMPPLTSAAISSAVDTALFFSLAFAGFAPMSIVVPLFGFEMPLWASLGVCDYIVKLALALFFVLPYRVAIRRFIPVDASMSPTTA